MATAKSLCPGAECRAAAPGKVFSTRQRQWSRGSYFLSLSKCGASSASKGWPSLGVRAAEGGSSGAEAQVLHPQDKATVIAAEASRLAEEARLAHAEESGSHASVQGGGAKTDELIAAEAKLFVHTYARAPVVFVSGEGSKLYDADGKEYLDLAAGIAVNSLGHSDPAWVKAVTEQASTLAHTSNLYHTIPQVKLAKRLVDSSFADRVFFSNSGTEANEAAIKFARKYQRVKAKERQENRWWKLGEEPAATEFVAFTSGFHGRTLGALALTSKVQYRAPFEPIMPGVKFVEFGDLEAVKKVVRAGVTAAVFVEPVQGEGGIIPAVATFLRGLRNLCDEAGVLLVFDEVQCGLGRTGRLWAHESYGVQPDIMTLAKPLAGGLPIGAVLVTEAVASAINPGDHGSTFAGGPLVCAAALAVLDRLQEPGFLESVAAKGRFLKSKLQEALGSNKHVKEVRGSGLLVGIQLDVPAAPLVDAAREQGLIVITAGKGDVVRLAPPLVITLQELEQAANTLAKCLPSLG